MMKPSVRSNAMLLLTALVWGFAFAAQDAASGSIGPFSFNAARLTLSALSVAVFCFFRERAAKRKGGSDACIPLRRMNPAQRKALLLGGLCCGAALGAAGNLQQIGFELGASAGKAGFLTAMYILFVPLFGALFLHKKPRLLLLPAIALSAAGLYLLCINESLRVEASDWVLLLCALLFAAHILVIDAFSPRTDSVKLSLVQFVTAALFSLAGALAFEKPSLSALLDCWLPIVYAGVLSGGLGYTLEIVAQKNTDPTVASLILCLESVFAVIGGWLILGDSMTAREYAGCGLMLAGILLTQLPEKPAPSAPSSL